MISQPLVGGENCFAWARSMERALSVKNRLGFIDGTSILTPSMAKEPLIAQAWTRCNNIVVTWILNCVSPRIATIVTYQLQKDLASISQGDTSVGDYFTQLTIFWDEIQNFCPFPWCSYGKCTFNVNGKIEDLQHKDSVMQLLMG